LDTHTPASAFLVTTPGVQVEQAGHLPDPEPAVSGRRVRPRRLGPPVGLAKHLRHAGEGQGVGRGGVDVEHLAHTPADAPDGLGREILTELAVRVGPQPKDRGDFRPRVVRLEDGGLNAEVDRFDAAAGRHAVGDLPVVLAGVLTRPRPDEQVGECGFGEGRCGI
jgi:hypothetical protein